MGEGRLTDQAFPNSPSVEPIKTGNSAVPGTGGYPVTGIVSACTVIGEDILTIGLPNDLTAGFRKKTDPDEDVIAKGTKGMAGSDPAKGKFEKETVEIRIVERSVSKDHGDVGIKPFCRSALLNGNVRKRRYIVHKLFNLPPDPHPGSRPPPAMWERCGRPGKHLHQSCCIDTGITLRVGTGCQDKATSSSIE
jgi:hypothetical protein